MVVRRRDGGMTCVGENQRFLDSQWQRVSGLLRAEIGEAAYRSWLRPMTICGERDGFITMKVPTRFMRDWVVAHYADRMRALWGGENPTVHGIDIVVAADGPGGVSSRPDTARLDTGGASARPCERASSGPTITMEAHDGGDIGAPLDTRFTFDNFVVGKPNEFAYAAARRIAEAGKVSFNPLFLYGGVGLGKTHLMHAIGHAVIRSNPEARVAYLSTEKFTNEFIQALQDNALTRFRQRYRHVDILLIDDVQFLASKERIQEEFFHTFNDLFESGKQIVLTSDRRASEIQKLESRLVSRFEWGLPADIQAPDLETRFAILRAKAQQLNCNLPEPILSFIAQNITRNIRRLEGALLKVSSYSALTSKPVDLATAERLLHDVLMEQAQNMLTIETIQKRVADHFQIRHSDMTSKRRPNNIAIPRQIAMFLARTLTKHSLQEIGDAFGGRDHGTVIHACKAVDNMCEQDSTMRSSVEFLKAQLSR